ncbi:hypothetical protein P168DRAFT_288565 [Aspergillus campestris IBT 28561]|uniref:Haloacid dehalogenase-like hydrolase n=1 Tax=Aspergillus campestris (strain IBT 28561) TaxID=1392248 RepID=A0A2I1D9U8_ASPC2|nr:uncharacterized protein P168DRAFT_288565 [Aspergillus campestris IBT 28561]PKY06637.1 hypothetical protein P168DRAFT_288565 [Aspergillus campestris IBT 28561]
MRTLLLTLDAFNTLFHPRPSIPHQYASVAHAHGLPRTQITPERIQSAFKAAYKDASKSHPNYGRDAVLRGQYGGPRQWWEDVVRSTFTRALDAPSSHSANLPEGLVPALLDRFASKDGYALYDDARDFIARMRRARYETGGSSTGVGKGRKRLAPFDRVFVGVVSNSDDRISVVLESLGVRVGRCRADEDITSGRLPGFEERGGGLTPGEEGRENDNDVDLVVTSYEAGAEKPNRRIFDVARRQAGRVALAVDGGDSGSADEGWTCVHVGDDLEKDYRGALAAGWGAYYIPREGDSEAPEGVRTVRSLVDLIPALEEYK